MTYIFARSSRFPTLFLALALLLGTGFANQAAAQARPRGELSLAAFARPLPSDRLGPFVRTPDGAILAVGGTEAVLSHDEGATWSEPIPLFPPDVDAVLSEERAVLTTREGTIIVAFMNLRTRSQHNWDSRTKDFVPDIRLEVWTVRSTDGGRSWRDAQAVQNQGYAGCVRGLAQAENGDIVIGAQDVARDPARHVTTAYFSTDQGKSWERAAYVDGEGRSHAIIDIGGHGHHDGAIEPTIERLRDGRLWMLIRTGHDRFWEAFSHDHGRTWRDFEKTSFEASAAPGLLKRLASGRLLLVWNRLYPEGADSYERRGPDWHRVPASYHREELSAALSDDDGRTWSRPIVLARQEGAWLSYPYVFERAPGELWLTTMQGGLRLAFQEADLLKPAQPLRKAQASDDKNPADGSQP